MRSLHGLLDGLKPFCVLPSDKSALWAPVHCLSSLQSPAALRLAGYAFLWISG